MRSIPIGLILVLATSVGPVSAQIIRAPLSVVVLRGLGTMEYIRPLRNDAIPVFLVGEDIVVEWQLSAGAPKPLELEITSGESAALLDVALLEAPEGAVVPRLVGSGFTRRRGSSLAVPEALPVKTLRLRSGESMSLFVKVEGVTVPGKYKLRLRPAFSGPDLWNETVDFALRSVGSKAERAELAFRRIVRAASDNNCRRVRQGARGLLAIHPFAASAHEYIGDCALKEGNRTAAIEAFERARALLDQQRDDLLLANFGEEAVQGRADSLRERVKQVRSGRTPKGVLIE